MHLTGKATQWHHNYMSTRYGIFPLWTEYIVAISSRFCELYDDPLAELVELKQGSDTVIEFLDKFEVARMRLVLPEAHALSIFLANLNRHLSLHTRQFEITSVGRAAKIAMLHESSILHTPKPAKTPFNPNWKQSQNPYYKPSTAPPLLPTPTLTSKPQKAPFPTNSQKNPKKFSYQEMQDRRAKGLCMFCDEVYTPGHSLKHKKAQIFFMECEDDDVLSSDSDDDQEDTVAAEKTDKEQQALVISVNALTGSSTFNCMRVIGYYGKCKLFILIDNGSTHNFLDLNIANEIGCMLEKTKPMDVTAASGCTMLTKYRCSNFSWKMQGYSYTSDIRTLPLDCCDLVLGVQWLSTLGPILWDFLNPRMEFTLNGTKNVLRGVTKNSCKVIKGSTFNKLMLQQPQIAVIQLREVTADNSQSLQPSSLLSHLSAAQSDMENDPRLQALLSDFSTLFEEPVELPPFRDGFDHRIPLESGANPVNLRPYCYSTLHKDVIDTMVKEMLNKGIIQCSTSPYASPVVLVKKKDGSWRLCVDFRGLNKQTIKDKYPIPLLEDLLDEFGSAKYFSKLDLRSGFHQLRM